MSAKVKCNDESNVTEIENDNNESGKNKNMKKCDNSESNLEGAIEELGTNVCCHGQQSQAKHFVKTTKAIGDCVGRVHNKDMKNSVVDGAEMSLIKPTEPTGEVTQHWTEKCKEA